MRLTSKTILVSLASTLLLSNLLPVFADSIWVPRLGYPSTAAKRVYLNVVTSQQQELKEEQQEALEKAAKKAQKENQKAEKQAKKEAGSSANVQATAPETDTKVKPEKASRKLRKEQKESVKKAQDGRKNLTREEARKLVEKERIARQKHRIEALKAKKESMPVEGNFFLYDVRQSRLLFKESPDVQAADANVAPYFVEFQAPLLEGPYDLAIRGSGHRSKKPLWISDALYWDALQPVLQGIGKTHCPQEPGKYYAMQKCYQSNALSPENSASQETILVQGGWFTESQAKQSQGIVKDTQEIANLSQVLLYTYEVNPKSYKYATIDGSNYEISPLPDLLDEVNWGLQFLLSSQQANGGFPAGLRKQVIEGRDQYQLLPATPQASAWAVMALATGARSFQKEDLSQAVKMIRAAEKGWRYLQSQGDNVSPELQLMASSALMQVSDDPFYAKAFGAAKSQVRSLSPQTALLIGPSVADIPVSDGMVTDGPQNLSDLPGILVSYIQQPAAVTETLSRRVTDLYGYEEIPLVKDEKLEATSPWWDPLQWMATKTGEVATRFGQRLEDSGIMGSSVKISDESLKQLETQEKEAKKRVQKGYEKLSLTTLDKVYLAYALALLNQNIQPNVENPGEQPAEPDTQNKFQEPPPGSTPQGFYRREI